MLSTHRPGPPFRSDPSLYAIAILLCAGVLIVYLQHSGLQTLQRQTAIIQQQVAQRAADAVAAKIKRSFDGPAIDTLAFLHQPPLEAGRLDLVARQYEAGLAKYPQVDRFFLWYSVTDSLAPGEVLFFGRPPADGLATGRPQVITPPGGSDRKPVGFHRDAPLGRLVYEAVLRNSKTQRTYSASQMHVANDTYDALALLLWTGPDRLRLYAISGYVVSHARVRRDAIPELYRRSLAPILNQGQDAPPLALTILDAGGETVFGSGGARDQTSGRALFDFLFYSVDQIGPRLAGEVPLVRWEVVVSQGADIARATWVSKGYGLLAIAVLLVLVALGLAVQGRSRSARLAQMQIDFVSHVSHQLKTPLSLLSAAAETLDSERVKSSAKLSHYIGIMRNEIDRLSTLVGRVLEFSRSQTRSSSLELERVDLEEFLRETTKAFREAVGLGPRDVSIRFEGDDSHPVVAADPAALEQVVANLLDNAVKYSPAPRTVIIRVGQSGLHAVVEVQDQGRGIAREDRERIFEKFYRGHGANASSRGFGLGLAIVQELVTAHHGRIEVESEVGRGTTFRLRLPLIPDRLPIRTRTSRFWTSWSRHVRTRETRGAQGGIR
jgi:signal transduction histidine kinase